MPDIYLEKGTNKDDGGDIESQFSELVPGSSRSNSVWTNTNMVKDGV